MNKKPYCNRQNLNRPLNSFFSKRQGKKKMMEIQFENLTNRMAQGKKNNKKPKDHFYHNSF
jgi:hypothetical protein